MNDLISRQPEQRTLTEDDYAYCTECDHVEMCRWYPMYGCEFKSRPSAQSDLQECEKCIFKPFKQFQPEQRWIPCSERLPEEKDAGILKKLGTNKRSEYVLATVEVKGKRMTVTACTYDGVWHWDKKYAFPDYKIIAWMPLPPSYIEGKADP